MPGPRLDRPVAAGGYAWWYLDATSDDGREAVTLIAFVGSVFSPYYVAARRRGAADPMDHVAINVALYRQRGGVWCMTERGRAAATRTADTYAVGPSALRWDGSTIRFDVDEVAVPWPRRLRGSVTATVPAMLEHPVALDGAGRHRWRPLAPLARVEVDFSHPRMRWSGHAYIDSNDGDEPLEHAFNGWHWSRMRLDDRRAAVHYDVEGLDGTRRAYAFRFEDGTTRMVPPQRERELPRTRWGLVRRTRGDGPVALLRSLEDTPFYARALLDAEVDGMRTVAVHESLSLSRFGRNWVQWMLPFRMPRRSGR